MNTYSFEHVYDKYSKKYAQKFSLFSYLHDENFLNKHIFAWSV